MASAASLLETFKRPLHEIHGTFRKSELVIMSWRSRETLANMKKLPGGRTATPQSAVADAQLAALERRLGPIADKMVDDSGDVDLGRLTGAEAQQYMAAMGIPVVGRV